jgi:hypothetical protein
MIADPKLLRAKSLKTLQGTVITFPTDLTSRNAPEVIASLRQIILIIGTLALFEDTARRRKRQTGSRRQR